MNAGLHTRAALGSDRYPHSAVKGAHPQTAAVKDNDKGGADVGGGVAVTEVEIPRNPSRTARLSVRRATKRD